MSGRSGSTTHTQMTHQARANSWVDVLSISEAFMGSHGVRVDLKGKVFSREFSLSEERQKTTFQYKNLSIRNPV